MTDDSKWARRLPSLVSAPSFASALKERGQRQHSMGTAPSYTASHSTCSSYSRSLLRSHLRCNVCHIYSLCIVLSWILWNNAIKLDSLLPDFSVRLRDSWLTGFLSVTGGVLVICSSTQSSGHTVPVSQIDSHMFVHA